MEQVTGLRATLLIATGLCGALAPAFAAADTAPRARSLEEIVIFARERNLIGEASAASSGVIGYGDFSTRPLLRPGELVEVIPGVIATQHSGTGKANQFFLRGFNLDHGTDFSVSVDGVPVNLRSHGHGQGYLDLNFIIPELVETVSFRKGPYFATVGDFASAGNAAFKTFDRLDRDFVQGEIGEDGFYRAVGAVSATLLGGDLLIGSAVQSYDGPWVRAEDLEQYSGLAKFTAGAGESRLQLVATGYGAQWESTDQIARRAVTSGLIDRLGNLDPDLGGETNRASLSGQLDLGRTEISAYGLFYELNLFSNFTYFLDDPVNGDEFEQADRRFVYGGALRHSIEGALFGRPLTLRIGAEGRYDDISAVGLYRTAGRARLDTVRQDGVEELSLGAYGEAEIALTDRLRAILGLRGDYYDVDVESDNPLNSGAADDTILGPKASLAWRALDELELYANYGQGFHSNDARGATIAEDPVSGDPVDPVDLLVRSEGAEIGARVRPVETLDITLAAFWLTLDSELVFVGDAGTTEASGATRRYGLEASAFYRPWPWLVLDASAAWTHARFEDDPPGGSRIPGAVEEVLGAGVTLLWPQGFTTALRQRQLGEAPLIEDDSVRSEGTTLVNLGASYEIGPVKLALDALNLLDSDDNDITYFYESQLAGEAAPVADIHFHPVEPRTLRASLRVSF